jgi:hypothetical protein
MFAYWGLMGNPLIHLETKRNNRIDESQFQGVKLQFELEKRGIIVAGKHLDHGTYIGLLLPSRRTSFSNESVFTV